MECLLKKMMCLRFFRQDVHSHGSLWQAIQHFPGIALPEIFEHWHRLWFLWTSYSELDPSDLEETFCIFFALTLLSREDTEDGSALFDLR